MYIVYVVITLGGLIVLVNMLIAIMGDTFSRVQSNVVVYDYRERLRVILDLESVMVVFNRRKTRRMNIGVIRLPGGFDDENAAWEGGQTELKKLTKDGFRRLNKNLKKEIARLEEKIDRKLDAINS